MEKHRMFVAFPVSQEVTAEAARVQEELKKKNIGRNITWVHPDRMHVTLHFLGEIDSDQKEKAKELLAFVAERTEPFSCELSRTLFFPNAYRPHTLVIAVSDMGRGKRVEQELVDRLQLHQLARERKEWLPHVTLGRNRSLRPMRGHDIAVLPIVWNVNEMHFIKSELLPYGPRYTVEDRYVFGKT